MPLMSGVARDSGAQPLEDCPECGEVNDATVRFQCRLCGAELPMSITRIEGPDNEVSDSVEAETGSARFLRGARIVSRVALVVFLISIPGCANVDMSMGPGATPSTPGWATALAVPGFFAFLVLLFLTPVRIAVWTVARVRKRRRRDSGL